MDRRNLLQRCAEIVCFGALIWGPALFIRFLNTFLYTRYYVYTGWKVNYVMTGAAVLSVVLYITVRQKWHQVFLILNPAMNVIMAFCVFLIPLCLTSSFVTCLIPVPLFAYVAAKRVDALKLKTNNRVEEINEYCRLTMLALVFAGIIFSLYMLFDLNNLSYISYYFNLDDPVKSFVIVLALNLISCGGIIVLYAVLFLNIAGRMIKA